MLVGPLRQVAPWPSSVVRSASRSIGRGVFAPSSAMSAPCLVAPGPVVVRT